MAGACRTDANPAIQRGPGGGEPVIPGTDRTPAVTAHVMGQSAISRRDSRTSSMSSLLWTWRSTVSSMRRSSRSLTTVARL